MADIPMPPRGAIAGQMQQVAEFMDRLESLSLLDSGHAVIRNTITRLRDTLPQVWSALNNGDSGTAADLLRELDDLQPELDDVGGRVPITLTTGLSELIAECQTLAGQL